MPRILLVGNSGTNTDPSRGAGACIARTSRFQTALDSNGFHVDVCSITGSLSSISVVREALQKGSYSCIVAISPHPAEMAVLAGSDLPMWIDMNGMHPAEIHLSGEKTDEPRLEMLRILSLENTLLSRGDAFSAPSRRQVHSIMGELYLLGRMDASSKHLIPARPIPNCAQNASLSTGSPAGSTDFSIISTGSFNSWFDGDTLFRALEYSMKRNSNISFTATGGAVDFAEEPYGSFLKNVSRSEFRDRFRMAGWVTRDELEEIQMTASAAVYTDIFCGETLLGARTRVLDWISRGIPVVCTEGAEIAEVISDQGMGIAVPTGNPEALGEAFLKLASEPELIERIKESQDLWRRGPGRMEEVFKPLFEWCSTPTRQKQTQLCKPTVPRVSSFNYRKLILREIASAGGIKPSMQFLLKSLLEKLRKKTV